MPHPFSPTFEQLPKSLPIFPLSGAVILPGGHLPLNIFEPRYLSMVQDAMRSNQLIGMVQPSDRQDQPNLYNVGCVGRIYRYEETQDGRLEVTLKGLCRYRIEEELPSVREYRIVKPNWKDFESDLLLEAQTNDKNNSSDSNLALLAALKQYFMAKEIDTDWAVMEQLSSTEIVNNLFGYLPLDAQDKQLLIETKSREDQIKSFIAILNKDQDLSRSTRH